jgi:tetratricopeptide (TPR) repeat protein
MARAYIRLGEEGFIAWAESIQRGRATAEKAKSISPDLAEAHCVLADIMLMADDPPEEMQAEALRAIELNPNLAEGYDVLGQALAARGDIHGMVRNLEAAYQLDPLSPLTIRYLGRAYFNAGRLEDAMDHYRRTIHLDPMSAYRGMADYYFLKGDLESAEATVREMEKLGPTNEYTLLNRGYLAALRGDRVTAVGMISKLDATHEPGWSLSSSAGYIYLALGDLDKFFEYMFTALRDHTLQLSNIRFSPLVENARKDPRFAQLMSMVDARRRSKT